MKKIKDFDLVGLQSVYLDGKIVKTSFMLVSNDPFIHLPIVLEGDKRQVDHATLKDMAQEYLFKIWFVDKAMPEAIQKVDELDKKVEEVDAFLKKSEEIIKKIQERSELSQGSVLEVTEMVLDHEFRLSLLEGGEDDDLVDTVEDSEMEGGE